MVSIIGIDALVNNAAMLTVFEGDFFDIKAYNTLLHMNLVSPTALTRAALPKLRESKGAVVFISSAGGKLSIVIST